MKNRDKDGGESWNFKTYFKKYFFLGLVKMKELCSLNKFILQTPQFGESYTQQ